MILKDLQGAARYTPRMPAFQGVGLALAKLREARGLSQETIAQRMGSSHRSNVSKIESGTDNKASSIDRYLDALGATAHDLANALDEVNGRTPEPIAASESDTPTPELLNELFPGAPEEVKERYIVALGREETARALLKRARDRLRAYNNLE